MDMGENQEMSKRNVQKMLMRHIPMVNYHREHAIICLSVDNLELRIEQL